MGWAASSPCSLSCRQALVFLEMGSVCQGKCGTAGFYHLPSGWCCVALCCASSWRDFPLSPGQLALGIRLSGGLVLPLLPQNLCCSVLPTSSFPVMLLLAVGRAPAACVSPCPASGFTLW